MVKAIDTTGLSPSQVVALKEQGIKMVGRYLSKTTWKGLTVAEVSRIKAAGMDLFSIYETSPTHASYFSYAQGQADASSANSLAKAAGQPEGSSIYFTVDYDAQTRDFPAILDYFKAINKYLTNYHVGAYGSYAILTELQSKKLAEYWFQTVAWSAGKTLSDMHIYQAKTNEELVGVNVDVDELAKEDIGAWSQAKTKAPKPPAPAPKLETHKPVATPAPKEIHVNFEIKGLTGGTLGNVHDYVSHKGWWFQAAEQKDGTFQFEVGIFIAGSQSYKLFKDFLDTEKISYTTIQK